MKRKLKIVLPLIALLCVGVFIYAVLKSSHFSAPAGAKLTQQSVLQKLYRAPTQQKQNPKPLSASPKTSSVAANNKAATPTQGNPSSKLPNTGTGDLLTLFVVTSLMGSFAAYSLKMKKLN